MMGIRASGLGAASPTNKPPPGPGAAPGSDSGRCPLGRMVDCLQVSNQSPRLSQGADGLVEPRDKWDRYG